MYHQVVLVHGVEKEPLRPKEGACVLGMGCAPPQVWLNVATEKCTEASLRLGEVGT